MRHLSAHKAKACARLVAVRVLDFNGSAKASDVVSCLDWVLKNAQLPAVVHLGAGSDSPNSVSDAAASAVLAKGIPVVVSAGNTNSGDVLAVKAAAGVEILRAYLFLCCLACCAMLTWQGIHFAGAANPSVRVLMLLFLQEPLFN